MKATRTRLPGITLRDGAASDADAVARLLSVVNPDDAEAFDDVRLVLEMPHEGPLSHSRVLVVLAEDGSGRQIGALFAGPPFWLFDHPVTNHPALLEDLVARIGIISAVAVDPSYRGRGVGAELIRHAVRRFTRAGYGMLTLNCFPALEGYYKRLGFTIMDDLIVHLRDGRMAGPVWDDTRVAARPLDRHTALATVPGLGSPVVSGILPGSRVPDGAYFDGEKLRN
ncbi:GNAT family N-acetyltransferase [Streptomyces sp. NBC_01221]|uniref:GNAT family N-acetyltransferase n=1 Tax=Streptomyces sp. NBC_01221 TaxID=2903782 RepID=UPI002257597F|nr:GNAT family N-acetyltransferase [Streptomyces sp. NBC_01221]MCX4792000.1 GNAT family N-acetyltransferase [Streptomyces sp. NBC_01221]